VPVSDASQEPTKPLAATPVLSLEDSSHESDLGETIDIPLLASSFPRGATGQYLVKFDPEFVVAEGVESEIGLPARLDNTRGEVVFELIPRVTGVGEREIALITFRAVAVG